jgi:hypothetical protein
MEALLATGLLSLGRDLVSGIARSTGTTTGTNFANILDGETAASSSTSSADATAARKAALESSRTDLSEQLGNTPEVRSFIGTDNNFTVGKDENGYFVTRSDGMEKRLQPGTSAESYARDLHACCLSLDGDNISTPESRMSFSWAVTLNETEESKAIKAA